MKIVIVTHPPTMRSNSMPRFAAMLKQGLDRRGYPTRYLTSRPLISKLVTEGVLHKWASYVDQFILFPICFLANRWRIPRDSLFVFCDQALGPWVPLVTSRPHVIHCHDFLALRSALGEFPENRTRLTGRLYQSLIRWGFSQGQNFISVSDRTRKDLEKFGPAHPAVSAVVWNGLNHPFAAVPRHIALDKLRAAGLPITPDGMLLNIAGNQWYKNRIGLIRIYVEYVKRTDKPLPLWCVGPMPDGSLQAELANVPSRGGVHFLQSLDADCVQAAYSCAVALLFPSLEEGFGWPIIEAQACGCPVFTTDSAPMNEIGGPAALLMPRRNALVNSDAWQQACVDMLMAYLAQSPEEQESRRQAGLRWAKQFDPQVALNAYVSIYESVFEGHTSKPGLLHV